MAKHLQASGGGAAVPQVFQASSHNDHLMETARAVLHNNNRSIELEVAAEASGVRSSELGVANERSALHSTSRRERNE